MFLNDPNKNKALAGFVLVCPPHSEAAYQYKLPTYLPNTDTLYEIAFVAVDPAHEGKGFGKQMMRSLAQSLFERLRSAWLHVDDTNIRARKLYESLGFRSQYDIHDPYGSFGQVMVLRPPVQYSAISGNDAVVQTKGGIPTSM
jgi:ribosomal protein S18 acetylase RimI-like enzyme